MIFYQNTFTAVSDRRTADYYLPASVLNTSISVPDISTAGSDRRTAVPDISTTVSDMTITVPNIVTAVSDRTTAVLNMAYIIFYRTG